MGSGENIHRAIKRRDSMALRKMAEQARQETTRLFLHLLADLIERDLKRLKKTA